MTPATCLREAKGRIADPEKWGKGPEIYIGIGRRCVALALSDVCNGELFVASRHYLEKAIGNRWLTKWNDAPERTHAEVMAAFDRAIELAEAEHGR